MSGFSPVPKPVPSEKKAPKPIRQNAKRAASEFSRTYGSPERVAWFQLQPCVVGECDQPSENAHIEGDGMGRKADCTKVVPCCRGHHRTRADSLHQLGREAFRPRGRPGARPVRRQNPVITSGKHRKVHAEHNIQSAFFRLVDGDARTKHLPILPDVLARHINTLVVYERKRGLRDADAARLSPAPDPRT